MSEKEKNYAQKIEASRKKREELEANQPASLPSSSSYQSAAAVPKKAPAVMVDKMEASLAS